MYNRDQMMIEERFIQFATDIEFFQESTQIKVLGDSLTLDLQCIYRERRSGAPPHIPSETSPLTWHGELLLHDFYFWEIDDFCEWWLEKIWDLTQKMHASNDKLCGY